MRIETTNDHDEKLTDKLSGVLRSLRDMISGNHSPQAVVMSRESDAPLPASENDGIPQKTLPGHADLTARLRKAALMEGSRR